MNDVDLVRPVEDHEFKETQQRSVSLLQDKIDLIAKHNSRSLRLNYILSGSVLMLAASIVIMMPLKETKVRFLGFSGDLVETVPDISQLPLDKQGDAVKSSLWHVAKHWLGYPGRADILPFYDEVSALTTGNAQRDYQKWINTPDPTNPIQTLGENGRAEVHAVPNSTDFQEELDVCRRAQWCDAKLALMRKEKRYGQPWSAEHRYTVKMQFVFVDNLDAGEKTTINPGTIKVTEFHWECDDCGS